jgi:hypothetical protein
MSVETGDEIHYSNGTVSTYSGQHYPQDAFDTLAGWQSVSKNVIVVGNIEDFADPIIPASVNIAASSSWGPTDDGRIKPDLVASGSSIYTASSAGDSRSTIRIRAARRFPLPSSREPPGCWASCTCSFTGPSRGRTC